MLGFVGWILGAFITWVIIYSAVRTAIEKSETARNIQEIRDGLVERRDNNIH
ncbi:hypothetical protein M3201_06410 [Paenibacillus motobuensis]|uniref:hypothetical protein n=1 Tax=Paenibacillus TaxID=44249 RepID=UPI00203DACB3|nr:MULTISPECIES: hypothetical protein [Paenibacillus]MCM3039333.1 hypothetical protein [Paenibacillus lutimineralis]MCM3646437.1 hypothetical protein [Paenibacillus motobuensis]